MKVFDYINGPTTLIPTKRAPIPNGNPWTAGRDTSNPFTHSASVYKSQGYIHCLMAIYSNHPASALSKITLQKQPLNSVLRE
jgi:hypothetical protein